MNGWRNIGLLIALAGCGASSAPAPATVPEKPRPPRQIRRLSSPIVVRGAGFEAPESIIHDREADRYLVSNIAGAPLSPDDRAFISRLRPDGTVEALKWIDAAKPAVELHAPKGMAIVDRTLYVADIDQVRSFDLNNGHPIGSVIVPGASFLNDISAAPDGTLYVTDSGLGRGLTPTGTDAIFKITPEGRASVVTRTHELGQPSGIWALADGMWAVGFGNGELYRLDTAGMRITTAKPPKGSLDGVAVWSDRVFVSSWEAAAVFEQTASGFVERIGHLNAPADLAIDEPRSRLLITHYNENAISIHQL